MVTGPGRSATSARTSPAKRTRVSARNRSVCRDPRRAILSEKLRPGRQGLELRGVLADV